MLSKKLADADVATERCNGDPGVVCSSSNLPRVVLTALVELKTKRTLYVLSVFHPVSLQNIVLEAFSDANVREHIRVGDVDR